MTVTELISRLAHYPPTHEVILTDDRDGSSIFAITMIREATASEKRRVDNRIIHIADGAVLIGRD